MRKLFAVLVLLPALAFGQTIVTTTKTLTGGWRATDFASYEVRLTGRKGTDLATANKIIARIALKTLDFSLLTQRVTILVPANEVWEVKGLTMHFVPINTTGIKAFDVPLIDFAASFFPTPGQVLAIDMDAKSGNLMMGPVTIVPTPAPAPLPQPPAVASVGSTAVPGQSLTTAQGVWSFDLVNMGSGGNVLLLNGAPAGGSGIKLVVSVDGLKVLNTANQWWLWNGSGWGITTAP